MNEPVTVRTKLTLGVMLPAGALLLFDLLLLRSVGGKGEDLGFAGMALYFRSFITVPAVLIASALLMRRDWKSKGAVFLAGMLPPTVVAVYEFISLYGHQ